MDSQSESEGTENTAPEISQHALCIVLSSLMASGVEPDALGIKAISKKVGVSVRTIQRTLKAEGTTFSEVLETVRKLKSMEMILKHEYSIDEISSALGFSNRSGYFIFHKKWFGVSPQQFRTSNNISRASRYTPQSKRDVT